MRNPGVNIDKYSHITSGVKLKILQAVYFNMNSTLCRMSSCSCLAQNLRRLNFGRPLPTETNIMRYTLKIYILEPSYHNMGVLAQYS